MTTGDTPALLYTDGTNTGTWAQFTDPDNPEAAGGYIGPDDPGTGNDAATLTIRRAMETMDGRLPIATTGGSASFLVVPSGASMPIGAFGVGDDHTSTISRAGGSTSTTQTPDLAAAIATTGPAIDSGRIYFLVAANNDEITITARGTVDISGGDTDDFSVTNDFTVKVDSQGPQITDITPAGNSNQSSDSASFGATFTDAGSGLISDAEQPEYGDTNADGTTITQSDGDGDDITANEPLAVSTADGPGGRGNGAARDINIHVARSTSPPGPTAPFQFGAATDITSKGSSSWRKVTNGFSVSIVESPLGATNTGGVVYYGFLAKDRVGNVTISGLDAAKEDSSNHRLTIDRSPPRISEALAGRGYKASAAHPGDDANDLKSIKVIFSGGIVTPAVETLDVTTIEASDFSVVRTDGTEMEVVSVNTTPLPAAVDSNQTVNNIVYLTLANDLPPAATPRVSVVGSISDLAGNRVGAGSVGGSIVATDKTAPVLRATVTGSVTERVAATGQPNGQITIRVTSNEPLRDVPALQVARLVADGTAIEVSVRNVLSKDLVAVQGLDNTWEVTSTLGGERTLRGLCDW